MLSGLFKLFTAGIATIFVVLAIVTVAFFALLTLIAALIKPIIIIGSIAAAVWLTAIIVRRSVQARQERVAAAE
jgi:cytochrome c biogenesis protein CcdA